MVRKGAKADPVGKVSVDQLLGQLEADSFVLDDQPYSSLFKIYHREFLSQSITKGLINFPPCDKKEWKKEFNARTSAERSNKREKIAFQLENGRHRSTKMCYCRLYHIMMLQHLDAWDLPFESPLRKLILEVV